MTRSSLAIADGVRGASSAPPDSGCSANGRPLQNGLPGAARGRRVATFLRDGVPLVRRVALALPATEHVVLK
jgi:hypothetical protein